jgi:hypothetical protein
VQLVGMVLVVSDARVSVMLYNVAADGKSWDATIRMKAGT